jgi:hypothetical protein
VRGFCLAERGLKGVVCGVFEGGCSFTFSRFSELPIMGAVLISAGPMLFEDPKGF